MHEPAITHRSQQSGKRNIKAQDASPHIAIRHGHGVARPEDDVIEHPAVFPQGDFTIGAAIEIVEDGPRQSTLGQGPKIPNAYHTRRCHCAGPFAHRLIPAGESSPSMLSLGLQSDLRRRDYTGEFGRSRFTAAFAVMVGGGFSASMMAKLNLRSKICR